MNWDRVMKASTLGVSPPHMTLNAEQQRYPMEMAARDGGRVSVESARRRVTAR